MEPRRDQIGKIKLSRKRPLKEIILENKRNIVILGQPGSGKTTSVKYIVNSVLHDSNFLNEIYKIPIVIRLRELNKSNSVLNERQTGGIFERLSLIFGLETDLKIKNDINENGGNTKEFISDKNEKLIKLAQNKIILNILDSQKILLILDGFDEIIDENIKNLVESEIKDISERLNTVNFILTSRSADYKIKIENTDVYEISDLNEAQIKDFSNKWFENKSLSKRFLKELSEKKHCKDFTTRPLLLTQLAQIYSRTDEIPDKPKMIYQRIVEIVLKEWNEQQGIKRKTKYSTFTVERKREFLSNMAFNLTIRYCKQVFTKSELASIYNDINKKFRELPINEVEDVVEEIETHNGLIVRSGCDSFEFSHLTIQEYFVADYIIRTNNIMYRLRYSDLIKVPNELAISIALSSEPSIYFRDLLVNILFKDDIDLNFSYIFFNRLKLENPDFESNVIVNVVLLEIYTNLCLSIQELSKRRINLYPNEENELNKKNLEEIVRINLIPELKDFYEYNIDNETFIIRGSSVIFLKKKRKIITDLDFPEYLYCLKELYEIIE